ncbi:MAG: Gfo/Idh/MocA family oxidoreductase [Acetobacteraceae bacterium]|nr:Gfo/Idh/MocA family oxidoreductase [Acetobacteraceae bacterium]
MGTIRLALIGAGGIGRAHLHAAAETPGVSICAIADPNPAARAIADAFGKKLYPDHRALLDAEQPDGVIIATPNALHVPVALDCVSRGVPVLVEKPVADTMEAARLLLDAARKAGVPVLVGHHRRHNRIIRRARRLVQEGALGRLVAVSALALFLKPDGYFDVAWRKSAAGGPVLINLIHEIDMLRFVCGEIVSVGAATSNEVRRFAVEDTASIILRLENGALATVILSDTAASPWSWDVASGESSTLYKTNADSHFLCGTEGSLTLPSLTLWRYPGARGWGQPILAESMAVAPGNPYAEQLRHFAAVIRREEAPLTSADDGSRTLAATLAVKRAAGSGEIVTLAG